MAAGPATTGDPVVAQPPGLAHDAAADVANLRAWVIETLAKNKKEQEDMHGGIREKLIASKRVGITELIFSERNRKDFEELPAYLRRGMSAHFVKLYPEVAEIAFRPLAKKRKSRKRKS